MDALLRIDTASTFTQFRAAAKLLATPSQNLVYAGVDGTIGYQLPGAIPERGRGDGDTVSPGWDTDFDWKGLIPFDELPWRRTRRTGSWWRPTTRSSAGATASTSARRTRTGGAARRSSTH